MTRSHPHGSAISSLLSDSMGNHVAMPCAASFLPPLPKTTLPPGSFSARAITRSGLREVAAHCITVSEYVRQLVSVAAAE